MERSSRLKYLGRPGASGYLLEEHGIQLSPRALANLAVKGEGPPFEKQGGRLTIYATEDLDAFAKDRKSAKVRSTSELPKRRQAKEVAR